MSRHHARACAGQGRASPYDEITDKIIAELEAGRVPWVQPWGTAAAAKAPLALPKNAATSRRYGGINILILWGSVVEHGEYDPRSAHRLVARGEGSGVRRVRGRPGQV
jgi:antirestriction protein ArdC